MHAYSGARWHKGFLVAEDTMARLQAFLVMWSIKHGGDTVNCQ